MTLNLETQAAYLNLDQQAAYCGHQYFHKLNVAAIQAMKKIATPLKMAITRTDKQQVIDFLSCQYKANNYHIKPDLNDRYFKNALTIFATDDAGSITGTFSLAFDSDKGLPDERLFANDIKHYRANGLKIVEMVRWVINAGEAKKDTATAMECFKVLYQLTSGLGADIALGLVRQKEASLHQKFGAVIFNQHIRVADCPKYEFATAGWPLKAMQPCFFHKTRSKPMAKAAMEIYPVQRWDEYTRVFTSVQTSFQRDLQQSAIKYLSGDVADFGCGSGKLAPLLADIAAVESYLGIDYANNMIKAARSVINQFELPSFGVWQGKIEEFREQEFDSAVCLNSFYTWPDPKRVIEHIHSLIKPQGTLILATPNPQINMTAMEQVAKKELFAHPDWPLFREINFTLVDNSAAKFIAMDDLIRLVQAAGFAVQSCHQRFYLGGLNFLVLKRT